MSRTCRAMPLLDAIILWQERRYERKAGDETPRPVSLRWLGRGFEIEHPKHACAFWTALRDEWETYLIMSRNMRWCRVQFCRWKKKMCG